MSKVTTKAAELEDRLANGHFLLDDEDGTLINRLFYGVITWFIIWVIKV